MRMREILYVPSGTCPLDFLGDFLGKNSEEMKANFWLSQSCRQYLREKTGAKVIAPGILFWPADGKDKFALLFLLGGRVIFGKFCFGIIGNIFSRREIRMEHSDK